MSKLYQIPMALALLMLCFPAQAESPNIVVTMTKNDFLTVAYSLASIPGHAKAVDIVLKQAAVCGEEVYVTMDWLVAMNKTIARHQKGKQ